MFQFHIVQDQRRWSVLQRDRAWAWRDEKEIVFILSYTDNRDEIREEIQAYLDPAESKGSPQAAERLLEQLHK